MKIEIVALEEIMMKKVIKFFDHHRLLLVLLILLFIVLLFLTINSYLFLHYDFNALNCTKEIDEEYCYYNDTKILKNPEESAYAFFEKYNKEINELIEKYNLLEEMQNHYEKYLSFLQKNNFEIEFEKIHFIKKDLAIRQLNKFQNQKRNYLKELLKLDSKDITI